MPPLEVGSAVPDRVTAKVPEVVIVEGETDKNAGSVNPTDVTVPLDELVPAPIALRKLAASKADTVLSALKRGKVTALGLVRVNMLLPIALAPRLVRAPAASVALVPPLAIGSVPDTCVVKLTPDNEPPSVSDPDEVTVPVNVMPLTVPVPDTLVTEPPPAIELSVPPDSDRPLPTVISSIAPVLAVVRPRMRAVDMVIPLVVTAPDAAAPRFVRAVPASAAPVPPLATTRVPPSVRLPEVVTVPLSVSPVVPPEPVTEVTVPVLLVYPDGLVAGYAPSAESARGAVVAPVPPLAMGNVPVTLVVRLQ